MTPESNPRQYCPARETALFQGRFSSKMRELVMGSSRRDALSAVRRARLEQWSISADNSSVELREGVTTIQLTTENDTISLIAGRTAHGDFRVARDHWIAGQISRRIERRLQGYHHALRGDAEGTLAELCRNVQAGQRYDWRPLTQGAFLGSKLAMQCRAFSCTLKNGLIAEVRHDVVAGYIPPDAALQDYLRFQSEMRIHQEQWRDNSSYGSYGSGSSSGGASFGSIRPPISPGGFRDDTITVQVYHEKLSQISKMLGFSDKKLCSTSVCSLRDSVEQAVWRQAVASMSA